MKSHFTYSMHDLSDMQLEEASTAAAEAYKILEQNGAADLMNRESKKKAQSDMNDDQLQAYLTYMRAIGYQSTAMNYRQSKNIKAVLAEVQPMVLIRPQDLDADPSRTCVSLIRLRRFFALQTQFP